MMAKDKKPAGFLIYVQDILPWLAGFAVKILSKLATPEEYATPQRNRLRISQGEHSTGQADLHRHTDVYPPTWQKASGWRNALAKNGQASSI